MSQLRIFTAFLLKTSAKRCLVELGLLFPGYDYFGFKTLEKSYLLRVGKKVVERPQHMLMRAACGIHCGDLVATVETYDLMSRTVPCYD